MSSLFVHVTVAPTGTVIVCGPKTKLSMFTAALAEGWSFAVTLGDPATSSTIAIATEAVKLAIQTLFRFIVLFPLQFKFLFSIFIGCQRCRRHSLKPKTPSPQVANRQRQGCDR